MSMTNRLMPFIMGDGAMTTDAVLASAIVYLSIHGGL